MKVTQMGQVDAGKVPALCPHCGHNGTFDQIGKDTNIGENLVCGQRRCPDPDCWGHIFVVMRAGGIVKSYPPIRIDFNSSDVPNQIRKTFEEALDCHANGSHVAAAIMIRRTLEEICAERGATGGNLLKRIESLKSKVVLPKELLDGLDDLRLLGNDAAHIEAKTFASVTEEELGVAIEFAKEIIKALYQFKALRERMDKLKKSSS